MKITEVEIAKINAALIKAGINYADIRMELTDHIAAALEQEDGHGDFNHRLKGYMLNHKKDIRKMNFAAMRVAGAGSLKAFAANLLTLRILLVATTLLAGAKLASQYLDNSDMVFLMFNVFSASTVLCSYRPVMNMLRKKADYSFTHGLGFIPAVLFFPSIYMMRWLESFNVDYIILYYTAASVLALNIYFTTHKLFANYKKQYYV